jgi:hypothetical protein
MIRRPARSMLESACPLRLIDGEPVEPLRFIPVRNTTHTNHRVAASRDVGAGVTLSPAPVVKQVAR